MEIHVPPVRYSRRWFCYLDLLGFSQLVQSQSIDRILPLYEKALKHVERAAAKRKRRGISYSWFSDTFIVYSQTDSPEDFAQVEQAGRLFFQELVLARIPVRAALSCGDLYSQKERNVFIGRALIEAHAYGEGQDWIGFVLTPTTLARMKEIDLPVSERPFYRLVNDTTVLKPGIFGPVYAFAFNNGEMNRTSPYLEALLAMRETAPAIALPKYERTIAFLKTHARKRPPSPQAA